MITENLVPTEVHYNLYVNASNSYYNTTEPIMSDDEFDQLREFLLLDEFYADKISNKIMSASGELIDADKLTSQMLSLFKIKYGDYSSNAECINEILNFIGEDNVPAPADNTFLSLKFDGMAIKVSNDSNGNKTIITRGGQDFTHLLNNHKDIKNITRPITHGEMVIKEEIFNEHYKHLYKNKRNCILGVIKINPTHLDFIELTDGVNHLITSPHVYGFDRVLDLLHFYTQLKELSPYLFDGIVVSNYVKNQTIKDNYPTNSVAVKFPSTTAKTKVIGMEWSLKKTANSTPVLLVEPTLLDGCTVSRVNGYNYGNLRDNKIGVGSEITICKSGDIIPIVVDVITQSDEIVLPEFDFIIEDIHLIATDLSINENYKFVLGFRVLQIDGFGIVHTSRLGEILISDIIDLFNPKNKQMLQSEFTENLFGKMSVVYDKKTIALNEVINMLQFPNCGANTSMKLAQIITKIGATNISDVDVSLVSFSSLEDAEEYTNKIILDRISKICNTKGINKELLIYSVAGEGRYLIDEAKKRLYNFGVEVLNPIEVSEDTVLFEMSGGSVSGLTKAKFMERLKEVHPNWVHSSLNKNTNKLIVDSLGSNSSKLNKARKLNIEILTYEQALE